MVEPGQMYWLPFARDTYLYDIPKIGDEWGVDIVGKKICLKYNQHSCEIKKVPLLNLLIFSEERRVCIIPYNTAPILSWVVGRLIIRLLFYDW